jgi:hypothetical protein
MGGRTKPCRTPASISLGQKISPSTKTLNFLFGKNILTENSNSDNLYKTVCYDVSKGFQYPRRLQA